MSKIYEKYFTWDDFLDYADWQEPDAITTSHDRYHKEWYGTPDFEAAMHLARYGWTEYQDKIKPTDIDYWDMLNRQPLWETKHSVVGPGVDVGRYNIGMPDCMIFPDVYYNDRFHASPKFVSIVINIAYCAGRNYDYVLQRGLNIIDTINTLEINNICTKIILLTNATQYEDFSDLYRIFIKIKDYQDIFYLEKLMFPIAHPSFLRRLIFSAQEREPRNIREKFGFYRNGGYGYPTNKFEYNDPNVLYFGTEPLHKDKVEEWIKGVLGDDSQNYDGYSRLDNHLDELQEETDQQKISAELEKYMQEKAPAIKMADNQTER